MRLLQQIRLFYQEGRSDKVYEVDLCEVASDRFVVNFRYGRRGAALRHGTKTKDPVERAKAERIFEKLVSSKRSKGYREAGEAAASADQVDVEEIEDADAPNSVLLERLDRKRRGSEPPLERTLWRLGERRVVAAVAKLGELTESKTSRKVPVERRYVIAWALGSIGAQAAIPTLEDLAADQDPSVRRIALHALYLCCDQRARAEMLDAGIKRLPQPILDAVLAEDSEAIVAKLREALLRGDRGDLAVIELLYFLSPLKGVHEAVLAWLRQAPFEAPIFQRIRHVYKAAELRLDSKVLALLGFRFETEGSKVANDSWWSQGTFIGDQWVQVKDELASPDSRIAYPSRTRRYLRKRIVRRLRRLGELGRREYVELATAALLEFSDRQAVEPRSLEIWDWQESKSTTYFYGPFSPYHLLNFILYRHSPRFEPVPTRVHWRCKPNYRPGRPVPVVREEAFPKLWDSQPEALLHLLLESRCEPVHEFAARALGQHEDHVDQLEVPVLARLLSAPYSMTLELALESARRRYDSKSPDLDLISALLSADLEEARAQAIAWVEESPGRFLAATGFVAACVVHRSGEVRELGRRLLVDHGPLSEPKMAELLARIVGGLLALRVSEQGAEQAKDAAETTRLAFADPLRSLGLDVLRDLLEHPLAPVQAFAGRVLLDHETPAESLPSDLLSLMLEAESGEVRGLGVQLLSQLSLEFLKEHEDLVLAYSVSAVPQVRAGARSILQKLMREDPAFATALTATLAVRLLRAERHEGLYADLVAMLSEDLHAALPSISADLTWRLLRSKRSGAQRVGALRLRLFEPGSFSTRKLALLAGHPLVEVRREAWQRLEAMLDRTLEDLDKSFIALESDWPESEELGFTFYRDRVPTAAWTAPRLVALCDSVQDRVQRLGQELIQRHFESEDGPEYLLRLSQHPSSSMQLFATHYLERYAAGHPQRIESLEPYFRSVLSQVCRGRVAKDRVLRFLKREALAERTCAILVLPLLERFSATVARGDRAEALMALRDIAVAHPDLPSPLEEMVIEERGSLPGVA